MQRWLDLEKDQSGRCQSAVDRGNHPKRAEDLQYLWNADWNFRRLDDTERQRRREDRRGRIGAMCLCWLMGTYYFAYSTVLLERVQPLLQQEGGRNHVPCTL